jgi:PAS domain S-box-containing protein
MPHEDAVRLGLMPPLTGLVGIYGEEITRAGRIACAEVNENGGVLGRPLELVIEDDGSLPASALAAATRLLDEHRCAALVGNLLSNSRIAVAYEVAEPRRVPYLNFSFYEGSILSRYFFHFAALPNQQIDRMIPYMREHFGPRIFFAGNNYEWPRGSIDAARRALEQAGGEAIGEEYRPLGASDEDFESLLDQLADSGADVFVPYFAGADQLQLLTRFTARGLKERMVVVMGHYDELMASRLPPEVRAGFYSCNTYFMTLDTPANGTYLARLSGQPGVNGIWPRGNGILTNFGEGAYLCVKAFAGAAERAGTLDPEALVEALETVVVSGLQGEVRMDAETHHAQVNTWLARCEADGSFTIVERFGAIPPVVPERYRHLRIAGRHGREDVYLQSRMMAQITDAVLLVHALEGTIVLANPGAERMFGYRADELAARRFSALLAPSGKAPPEETTAAIASTLSRKGIWQGEIEYIASNGRRFWCATSVSVFTHPRYGEAWMVLNKDITERKEAEERLRSASLYARSLIEASIDPLVTISAEGKITDVNAATVAATGVPRDQLLGSDFSDYFTEPGKARAGYEEAFAKGLVTEYPLALRHPSGSVTEVLYNASVYRDAKGEVAGVFAAARDVTERKRMEEAVRQLNLELEQRVIERTAQLAAANKELESFAYSVSHDLRVPLRAIDGYSDLLLRHYPDRLDDEGKRYLNVVRDSARRMAQLIDDILAFSRMGRLEMAVAEVDMERLAREALDELAPACAGRDLAVEIRTLPPASGDLAMLRQVWTNLLSNAVKFTRSKPAARIEAGGTAEGAELVYYVKDNGTGFDMQYADKLFGVFQRLHGVEEFEGTGIGLAIVKRIVTRHGGRAWAEGRVGEGATFYFTLPAAAGSTT